MTVKVLNEYTLPHSNRKAVIIVDNEANCFGVDFYENDSIIGREMYPDKSEYWAEDAAENWIFGVKKVVNGD